MASDKSYPKPISNSTTAQQDPVTQAVESTPITELKYLKILLDALDLAAADFKAGFKKTHKSSPNGYKGAYATFSQMLHEAKTKTDPAKREALWNFISAIGPIFIKNVKAKLQAENSPLLHIFDSEIAPHLSSVLENQVIFLAERISRPQKKEHGRELSSKLMRNGNADTELQQFVCLRLGGKSKNLNSMLMALQSIKRADGDTLRSEIKKTLEKTYGGEVAEQLTEKLFEYYPYTMLNAESVLALTSQFNQPSSSFLTVQKTAEKKAQAILQLPHNRKLLLENERQNTHTLLMYVCSGRADQQLLDVMIIKLGTLKKLIADKDITLKMLGSGAKGDTALKQLTASTEEALLLAVQQKVDMLLQDVPFDQLTKNWPSNVSTLVPLSDYLPKISTKKTGSWYKTHTPLSNAYKTVKSFVTQIYDHFEAEASTSVASKDIAGILTALTYSIREDAIASLQDSLSGCITSLSTINSKTTATAPLPSPHKNRNSRLSREIMDSDLEDSSAGLDVSGDGQEEQTSISHEDLPTRTNSRPKKAIIPKGYDAGSDDESSEEKTSSHRSSSQQSFSSGAEVATALPPQNHNGNGHKVRHHIKGQRSNSERGTSGTPSRDVTQGPYEGPVVPFSLNGTDTSTSPLPPPLFSASIPAPLVEPITLRSRSSSASLKKTDRASIVLPPLPQSTGTEVQPLSARESKREQRKSKYIAPSEPGDTATQHSSSHDKLEGHKTSSKDKLKKSSSKEQTSSDYKAPHDGEKKKPSRRSSQAIAPVSNGSGSYTSMVAQPSSGQQSWTQQLGYGPGPTPAPLYKANSTSTLESPVKEKKENGTGKVKKPHTNAKKTAKKPEAQSGSSTTFQDALNQEQQGKQNGNGKKTGGSGLGGGVN